MCKNGNIVLPNKNLFAQQATIVLALIVVDTLVFGYENGGVTTSSRTRTLAVCRVLFCVAEILEE